MTALGRAQLGGRSGRSWALTAGWLVLVLASCHNPQRKNPFDPELTPPVENVEATLDGTSGIVVVEWDAYDGAQPFGRYLVLRKVQGLEAVDTLSVITDPTLTRFEDTSIEPDTDYIYRVTVANISGFAVDSADLALRSFRIPEVELAEVVADNLQGTIILRWQPYRGPRFVSYTVWRRSFGQEDQSLALVQAAEDSTWTDNSALPETEYLYWIETSAAGTQRSSERKEAVFSLPAVELLRAEFSSDSASADLRWTGYQGPRFAAYEVRRQSPDQNELSVQELTDQEVLQFTDTSLDGNTEYTYRIFVRTTWGSDVGVFSAPLSGSFYTLDEVRELPLIFDQNSEIQAVGLCLDETDQLFVAATAISTTTARVMPADLLHFNPRFVNGETQGAAVWGDYDSDGDLDLYLPLGTGWRHRRNLDVLLRNDRGLFTDVSLQAGLTEEYSSLGAIWLDYDRDGFLDLYVTNESQRFLRPDDIELNRLYRNNGDGTFADVNAAVGLEEFRGFGDSYLAAPDLNNVGWPDLYVGVNKGRNLLFLNDGAAGFEDATTAEIADSTGRSFGLAVGDIDNDGDLDLFQPTAPRAADEAAYRSPLLLNLGSGEFLDVTETVGLDILTQFPLRSATLADFDNDGDLDLATGVPALLFLNNGDGLFTNATAMSGLPPAGGAFLVAGDYDKDGFLDLFFSGKTTVGNDFGSVYRNTGNENHYLRVELVGSASSNRNGIGARIDAHVGTLRQTRELLGGVSISQEEPVAHFGLGSHTQVDSLVIRWPSGHIDVHSALPVDRQIRLFEGQVGHHLIVPTRWEHTLPDSVVAGASLELGALVHPALFAADARIERVTADLSAWGRSAEVPLEPSDDGSYRLAPSTAVVAGPPGQREVAVLIEQASSRGPTWTRLVHPIDVLPADPPTEDFPIYTDDLNPNWQIEAHALGWDFSMPEIVVLQGGGVTVESSSRNLTYRGQAALAVHVDTLTPIAEPPFGQPFEVWQLSLRTSDPVEHYKSLRFAFHPGTAEVAFARFISVFINGRHLSTVILNPALAFASQTALDVSVREWHVVELPLDFPGVQEPIESISFTGFGFVSGTFHFDEISLLPGTISGPGRVTSVQEERESRLPSAFTLQQNYPNPFNSGTVIRFELPKPGETELAVYNLVGQKVVSLVNSVREAGSYSLRWDGQNDVGQSLASGVYFYRLQAGEQSETRKLLLLR